MQIKDIVAGKKTTFKDGQEKTQWTNIGTLFIKDDGKISIKINAYINPLAFANEQGEVWFNTFDHKTREFPSRQINEPVVSVSSDSTENKVVEEGKRFAREWAKMDETGTPF